jgi:hypothetical protein
LTDFGNHREAVGKRSWRWFDGWNHAVSEAGQLSAALWPTLPRERQRTVLLMFAQIILRRTPRRTPEQGGER